MSFCVLKFTFVHKGLLNKKFNAPLEAAQQTLRNKNCVRKISTRGKGQKDTAKQIDLFLQQKRFLLRFKWIYIFVVHFVQLQIFLLCSFFFRRFSLHTNHTTEFTSFKRNCQILLRKSTMAHYLSRH